MPLLIRHAGPDDHDALVDQFLGLNLYEEPFAGNRRTDRAGAEECLAAAFDRVNATGGAALVAELDGRVVGHLFLTFERSAVYVREELRPYAYVSELFVQEHARGAGAGAALMRQAERLAAERGVRRLMIGVLAGNTGAARFYERLGFEPFAIELGKSIGPGDPQE